MKLIASFMLLATCSSAVWAAPADSSPQMSPSQMNAMMGMDDQSAIGRVLIDELEYRDGDGSNNGAVWDAEARYGNDYDKALLRTEGVWNSGSEAQGRADLLWDRIITRWWSLQAGSRYDFGDGPGRGWAALGIAGIAPYWIDVEATAYLGSRGTVAGRFKSETDLLLTQRLILQPEVELNAYSHANAERDQGAGLSDLQAALRLRYAIRREIAPYAGVSWVRRFAASSAWQWVAGIHMLF